MTSASTPTALAEPKSSAASAPPSPPVAGARPVTRAVRGVGAAPAPEDPQASADALLDRLPVGLLTVDRRLMVRGANEQGRRLLGVHRRRASIGRRLLDGLRAEDRHRLRDTLSALPLQEGHGGGDGVSCGEVRFESGEDGERVLRVEARAQASDGHVVLACIDVTDSRAETERAEHRANHDALTGLPNRAAILEALRRALGAPRSRDDRLAVMFVDLDRFKVLNDTLGHEAGDRLLCEVATRLRSCLGERGVAARLGGDEFLVMLPRVAGQEEAVVSAHDIARALGQPLTLAGQEWLPTASIGVSLYPVHGNDDKSLLRHADLALYRAKREGRDGVRLYDSTMDAPEPLTHSALGAELTRALAQREFVLHFQPQMTLADGKLAGMGALLRWQHPMLGLLGPDRFIPLAEDSGMIHPLGEWVLRSAADQLAQWHKVGFNALRLSVKVSPRQLERPSIGELVQEVVKAHGLVPRRLQLQVAESAVARGTPRLLEVLGTLRQSGVGLALDRFGTGASSLAILPQVLPDAVRVDRAIVARVPEAQDACALLRAIVALARSLSLKVLAEGVERPAQKDFLGTVGVDEFQGNLAGLPMTAESATVHLRSLGPQYIG